MLFSLPSPKQLKCFYASTYSIFIFEGPYAINELSSQHLGLNLNSVCHLIYSVILGNLLSTSLKWANMYLPELFYND